MAILNVNPYATRQTVTLTSAEVWQVRGGAVLVQTGTPSGEADGIRLGVNDAAMRFASGEAVTVWRESGVGAQVVRMSVL